MRKLFSMAALAAVSVVLASCGGSAFTSSSTGTGGTGTTPTPVVASLTVTSDVTSIPSDGSSSANITVVAKDASNAIVSGAAIGFTATSGASVTATQGTTDSTGTAKATLSVGTAAAGASITVTASNGTVTGTTTVTVSNAKKTMTLLTSSPTIPSDNSVGATISALIKDANNNLLAGVPVSFMVSTGAVAPVQTKAGAAASPVVVAGTTDANGLAQAVVTTPGDPSNRAITVNATAGTATGQLTVNVTGTQLTLSGPGNVIINNSAAFTAVLTNAAGQGIPNTAMTASSALNNTLTASSLTTDSTGRATFSVKGVTGGNDTITVTALGLSKTAPLSVSPESFNITAPADQTQVVLGTPQTVTVTWTNNGAPVVNKPVNVVATRGTVTPITAACVAPLPTTSICTDANGQVQVSVSSTSAGPSIVQASGTDSTTNPVTNVSAQLNLQFVANTPAEIAVQAGPNAVSIQGQSTITAIVRDAAQNLVQGAKVDFQIVTDPTNGSLSTGTATTDALGQAQAVYTAGSVSSPSNGVTVSAKVDATSITASTTLTVGGQAVGLSFGTGNTVGASTNTPAIYTVTYTVLAVDSHGAPLPNQPITFSVLPVAYGKGYMTGCPGGQNWVPKYVTSGPPPAGTETYAYSGPGLLFSAGGTTATMCRNEDTDYTGNIASRDGATPGTCTNATNNQTITAHAKDYNCNGVLDPGSVATVSPSSGMTDANGRLDVVVTYNRDHAYWTLVQLIAATTVQGTQSSTSVEFTLLGAVSDYSCSNSPPGFISPYGQATTCADPR